MAEAKIDWIHIPHFNIHGNNRYGENLRNLEEIFGGISYSTLSTILKRYKIDFLMCGYHDTWNYINEIMKGKQN